MKILLVATVQSHICQFHRPLARMLHDHGCEVHVAARDNLAEKNGLKLDFADRVFNLPFRRSPFSPKNLNAYRELKRILDKERYNVVHCNTPVGGTLGRMAARKTRKQGTKVVYTAHGFHFYKGAPKKNWLLWYPVEKFMCCYTDLLITIAEEDYELARTKFPTQVEHIHGVGANTGKYRAVSEEECLKLKKELGCENKRLALCTGELNANKNQITAVRAMPEVIRSIPDAKLLLAGNGPADQELQEEIARLGMGPFVKLIGYHTDLERYVQAADLIVSCSRREGMPLNIVEGMLCEKAVVATINRGHKELVEDGVTGYLLPAGDAAAFCEKMISLFGDPELARKMGEAGREKALAYTDQSVYRELEEIYTSLGVL
ncbi:MAG: glycosyltransferase family 4 protein [Oscillospiraceae bacterium]|nr:glycosyltransferase family 4 protein [Oscillospiraceae bacterium]